MKRLLIYQSPKNGKTFWNLLNKSLPFYNGKFVLKIANFAFHGNDRLKEREVNFSEIQKSILAQIQKGEVTFSSNQVSELRIVSIDNVLVVVGFVLDDVVFAVHSSNFVPELRRYSYGLSEGVGFGLVKSFLSHPNRRNFRLTYIGDFDIVEKI